MKTILLVLTCVLGLLQSAGAYSLAGPTANGGDAWQSPVIGYGALKAPKNIGEEYRRNIPRYYYACDANFMGFFGSNGVVAVQNAFTILNNLTNVSSYSTSLSEFPLESRHINFQAQALGIIDLKSYTLGAMVEQLGLANPVQYTWTLHDRYHVGSIACPVGMEYLVVQRNFDFVSSPLNQLQYSPYVNNVLYSYQINEFCTGPNPLALAQPFSVDPLADVFSPISAYVEDYPNIDVDLLYWGDYYTGLTRDDMAGLRYLLKTNNINWESPAPGATLTVITTNFLSQIPFPANANSPSGYGTFDLSALLGAAKTNSPANMQLLFPGVIVATSSNYLTVVATPIVTATLKPIIGAPIGTAPKLVVVTNGYTYSAQTNYVTTFANIVIITNGYRPNPTAILQTITVAPANGAPLGSPSITNVSKKTITLTNTTAGSYYFLSPDLCPLNLLGILYTNVVTTTNSLTVLNTNVVTSSNTTTYSYSQNLVISFTNYAYRANPVDCVQSTNGPALYQGVENIKFVMSSYDSLLGQYFQPITNNYTMVTVVNSQAKQQHFQRVVIQPDFLFSAEDMASGPDAIPNVTIQRRNINFNQDNILPGLAGPGTIDTPTTITFDKVGPVYFNTFGDVMDGTPYFNATPGGDISDAFYNWYYVWGSYDGTTNAPVVYPNGTSIDNLENQIFIQVAPTSLINGIKGMAYPPTTFTATGGSFTSPFSWSLAFGSGMPAGMTLSSDGTLSGTPTQSGTFGFILQLTDSLGRSVQWNYNITIQ
ncbi:MAG: Ig domain-containing protein [Verrucomicrobiota bacterium]